MQGVGDIQKLMSQAKEMQDDLQRKSVIGESGAGLVKVTMNGKHDVTDIKIDSDVYSEDKEMLEELLAAAINDANKKIEQNMKSQLSSMGMPTGFGL